MDPIVIKSIEDNILWNELSDQAKQCVGGSRKDYENAVIEYSLLHQLRYKINLVKSVVSSERKYYENLVKNSSRRLDVYPYTLSDVMVKGLKLTPFSYYKLMLQDLMLQEKNYDCIPNFTAQDVLRLLCIGRNQYINIVNQFKAQKKIFSSQKNKISSLEALLPASPSLEITIADWWVVQIGTLSECDANNLEKFEKEIIDYLIDFGPNLVSSFDSKSLISLYCKGFIFLDVPIYDDDCIAASPLCSSFVMNCVSGDPGEDTLYKVFQNLDREISASELTALLQIPSNQVKSAMSLFCRLSLAHKINQTSLIETSSLSQAHSPISKRNSLNLDWDFYFLSDSASHQNVFEFCDTTSPPSTPDIGSHEKLTNSPTIASCQLKRVALVYDLGIPALLMMGNANSTMKSLAVTLLEVGKLTDDAVFQLIEELNKMLRESADYEADNAACFAKIVSLSQTLNFVKKHCEYCRKEEKEEKPSFALVTAFDLLKAEGLMTLSSVTRERILKNNYEFLLSFFTNGYDEKSLLISDTPHFGFPSPLQYQYIYVQSLTHSLPIIIPSESVLLAIHEMIESSPLLIQAYPFKDLMVSAENEPNFLKLCFPLISQNEDIRLLDGESQEKSDKLDEQNNPGDSTTKVRQFVEKLEQFLDLSNTCGYLTFFKFGDTYENEQFVFNTQIFDEKQNTCDEDAVKIDDDWVFFECMFGIPIEDENANAQILKLIQQAQLFIPDKMNSMKISSAKLRSSLNQFASSFMLIKNEEGRNGENCMQDFNNDEDHLIPNQNLLYLNGTLSIWPS